MAKYPKRVLVAALLVALASCTTTTEGQPRAAGVGGQEAETSSRPSIEPPGDPSSEPPTESRTSSRGNYPTKVGETARLCVDDPCTSSALEFIVHKIEVNPKCTEPFAPPPDNGHYIALSMTIITTDELTEEMGFLVDFSPFSFQVVGPDGVTETSDPGYGVYGCLKGSNFLPIGSLSPSSRYEGVVLLDSKYDKGVIVLRMPADPTGWEWTF
jgi:hypothetical protein